MKKLTKRQKAKNRAMYNAIRREYNKVKDKAPIKISYMQFKHRTLSRAKRDDMSVKAAAKREARTDTFLTAAERSRENLLEAIKENYNETWEELKNLSRNKGRYQSVKDNLTWDKQRNGYVLNAGDKQYFIDVTNSPEEVNIMEI